MHFIARITKTVVSKVPFIWRKLSVVKMSPSYQSYPGRANVSYISLQNLTNRSHEKQKVGSSRRVTLFQW